MSPFLPAGSTQDFSNICWLTTSRCPRLPLATFNSEPRTKSMIPSLPRATANRMLEETKARRDKVRAFFFFLTATRSPPSQREGGRPPECLTCPGWRWRSWLCRPSGPVWSPPRSRSCTAAPRRPSREAELRLEHSQVPPPQQTGADRIPSASCPHWACAGQRSHRWGSSRRCLWDREATAPMIYPADLFKTSSILNFHHHLTS